MPRYGYCTHSFWRLSSNTSTNCSTRLFAVRSSLPTVTRTGRFWNVLASRLTASGHVALTKNNKKAMSTDEPRSPLDLHIKVCLSFAGFVAAIIFRMSFSNPLSNIRSASSRTRKFTLIDVVQRHARKTPE